MMAFIRMALQIAAAFLILAGLGVAVFLLVPIRADMSVLFPEGRSGDLGALYSSLRDGPANRTILMSLAPAEENAPLPAPHALSAAFRDALQETGRFDIVANGEARYSKSAIAPFFEHRYRLNPLLDVASFSADGLRAALERLLRELRGFTGGVLQEIMPADPTLRTLAVATHWQPPAAAKRQGVWVDAEAKKVILLARTRGSGTDLAGQAATVERIRQVVKGLEPRFGELTLQLSGPPVIAVASRDVAENESLRLILVSVPLVAGLLVLFLRRFSALPILFLPLAAGFIVASAATAAIFREVHVTTLGFGVTLLGIAVDYPLHLMAHVRAGQRPIAAARRIWGALLIAVATTIFAFLPLAASSFPGLAQLGVFTAVGLATAVAVTRWVLPGLMTATGQADADRGSGMPSAIHAALRFGRGPALVVGAVALGLLLLRQTPLWQQDLSALSPIPETLKQQDRDLRRDLNVADPRYVLTIAGKDIDEALRRSESLMPHLETLEARGVIASFDMVARYLSSRARQEHMLKALPDAATLGSNLDNALKGMPFKAGTFDPFLQSVAMLRQEGPLTMIGLKGSLLAERLSPMILRSENGIKALVLLRRLRKPAELRGVVEKSGGDGVRFLDLKQSAQDLMDGYRAETLRWVALGAALAFGMLVLTLRSMRGVVAVAVPVSLSVLVTMTAIAEIAGGLSIFHLLGLLMVAGLGIDYAVFLWRAGEQVFDPVETNAAVRAVALCAVTSFSVFTLLATAAVPVLSQIGMTVAIGTALSLLLGLVFTSPGRGRTL
jgi:predicted exporter